LKVVQKFATGAKIRQASQTKTIFSKFLNIIRCATSRRVRKIPLIKFPKIVWRDRFTRPKRRAKEGFLRVNSG